MAMAKSKKKSSNRAVSSAAKKADEKPSSSSSSSSIPSDAGTTATTTNTANRPRNFLVRDATKPYEFSFLQYGKPASIVVDQTADDETWPGGALWDIGVILSSFFVDLAGFRRSSSAKKDGDAAAATTTTTTIIPDRVLRSFPGLRDLTLLELGCGVGLTGIVAAAVLGTQLAVLTDLAVVVEKVTEPNVEANSTPSSSSVGSHGGTAPPYRLTKAGKRGRILAMPLCWGNDRDEDAVLECFRARTKSPVNKCPRRKKSRSKPEERPRNPDAGQPDLIVIGDVAYQHYPGALSHFDILLSTVLRFLGPHTIVVFGTRMRMPASADLLDMFLEHMEEIVSPPMKADEIDPTFSKFKHQITIHIMRKRERIHSESA